MTERSSAELEGPSNGGKAYRRPLSLSGNGNTNLMSHLLANVADKSTCGSPHLGNTVRRHSIAIVHSAFSIWPTLDRESAWMLWTPGRWTGTNVITLRSHHVSSSALVCMIVLDVSHSHCIVAHQANHPGPQMRQEVSHSVDDGLHLQNVDVPRSLRC